MTAAAVVMGASAVERHRRRIPRARSARDHNPVHVLVFGRRSRIRPFSAGRGSSLRNGSGGRSSIRSCRSRPLILPPGSPQSPRVRNGGSCRVADDGTGDGSNGTQDDSSRQSTQSGISGTLSSQRARWRQRGRCDGSGNYPFHDGPRSSPQWHSLPDYGRTKSSGGRRHLGTAAATSMR